MSIFQHLTDPYRFATEIDLAVNNPLSQEEEVRIEHLSFRFLVEDNLMACLLSEWKCLSFALAHINVTRLENR